MKNIKKEFQLKRLINLQKTPPTSQSPQLPGPSKVSWLRRGFHRFIIGDEPKVRLSDTEEQKKRRRLALSVGGILLILLIVSVAFGGRRRQQLAREKKIGLISQRVDWVLSQAEQLSSVSPARARQILREEQGAVEAALAAEPDQTVQARFSQLIGRLKQAEQPAGQVVVAAPELYLDLNLIRENTHGNLMVSAGDQLLILDTSIDVVLVVSMVERRGETVGGGEILIDSRALAGTAKAGYVLTQNQIIEVILSQKTSAPVIIAAEEAWSDPTKIAAFAGHLYLLDRGASEIYKYPAIESASGGGPGFGERRRWLAPGITPDLSDVVDLAIDGDIWLLHRDRRVSRYRRGAPEKWQFSGLIDELQNPVSLSVPKDGARVWLLDADQNRVIAFDRASGDYLGQWLFEEIKATAIVVNEELGKIFLLAGERIYFYEYSQ